MADDNKPVLCGGTLLILLLQHRNNISNRSAKGKITEGTGEVAMFWQLCSVLESPPVPKNDKYFLAKIKTQVREYKQCNQDSVSLIPLTTKKMHNFFSFDTTDRRFVKARKLMKTYITEKINKEYDDQKILVASILETIKNDDSIDDDEIFYCLEKYPHKISKSNLLHANNLDLASFLTGILYYIFTKPVRNTLGKETFNQWMSKVKTENGKIEYIFSSDIGVKFANEHPDLISKYEDNDTESLDGKQDLEKSKELLAIQIRQRNGKLKTFININEQKNFEDIFVCNDISPKVNPSIKIPNISIQKLTEDSNFILINGSAGIGKSMMLRHLLLDACDQYNFIGKLPIFIPLWEFQNSLEELPEFFFKKYQSIGGNEDFKEFSEILESGGFIFFLDGMDELSEENFYSFASKLNDFTSKYFRNMVIISSRNQENSTYLTKFNVFEICPFSEEQAITLIDKLSAEDVKTELKKTIEQDFESTYNYFALTPLFLTLMIRNYPEFRDIPKTQHVYFSQLYNVLFRELDKIKGHRKRKLLTGLKAKQFEILFSEFCAVSYLQDKISFTEYEFDKCFETVNQNIASDSYVDSSDFRDDLTETLGLMVREGNKIRFWHKAFQEYFCALYYSNLPSVDIRKYQAFFAKMDEKYDKNICYMYINLVSKEKYEMFVTYPYISYLLTTCTQEKGYWTFLRKIYCYLSYSKDKVIIDPFSFLYKAVFKRENSRITYKNNLNLPYLDELLSEKMVNYRDEYCSPSCYYRGLFGYKCILNRRGKLNINPFDCDCRDKYLESEVIYKEYMIDFDVIYNNKEKYNDLVRILESDDFPLKDEYMGLFPIFRVYDAIFSP